MIPKTIISIITICTVNIAPSCIPIIDKKLLRKVKSKKLLQKSGVQLPRDWHFSASWGSE